MAAAGTLTTGLDLLEVLSRNPEGLGVTALALAVGGDKGNVHRLLRVLEDRGYVEQDPGTKVFRASVQMVSLAARVLRGIDLVSAARPVMRDLSEVTGEAVHLARRMRAGGVYVAREHAGSAVVTVETEIGARPVIHATATGKALYCTASPAELARVTGPEPFPRHTEWTITSAERLLADLSRVRERGYAVDDEELNLDVRCVAAPVFDRHGEPLASVGLSGPASRVTPGRLEDLGGRARSAASRITRETGGSPPASVSEVDS